MIEVIQAVVGVFAIAKFVNTKRERNLVCELDMGENSNQDLVGEQVAA